MLPREILALAQRGHPIAIGTLLNYILRSQGIKARVLRQDACLHVLLEGQQPLNPEQTIALVRRSVSSLNVKPIRTIMVYSRQQGHLRLDWRHTLQLDSAQPASPVDPSSLDVDSLLELSSLTDLPLPRRDPVTQASNFSPEPPNPASRSAIESVTSIPEGEQSAAVQPSLDAKSPHSPLGTPPSSDSMDAAEILPEVPELLKRPESVIFLLFISLLVFWDAYVDFIEDGFSPDTTAISASQLARRLKVSRKVIRRRKRDRDFSDWTQSLDPDQIAWVYRKGYYVSQL